MTLLRAPSPRLRKRCSDNPVVVVNKAGASTMLGMTAVAQSAPDGYTLGMDSTTTTNALAWEIANGRKPPITRE